VTPRGSRLESSRDSGERKPRAPRTQGGHSGGATGPTEDDGERRFAAARSRPDPGQGPLSERLADKRICICVGAGGVGKTTSAAAIALGLAAEGKRVAVVTIDPARRLAAALGMRELGNTPRRVDPRRFAGHGIEVKGELWAMMLDPKRTFDDLIARLAPDERSRDVALSNRIYRELSSAVAGSQEFTAVAKLYELDREGSYDVIVLDTPPSRNALDFINAPARLTQFFEGRALRVLLAPTGLARRVVGRGTGAVFVLLRRLTGVDFLTELGGFFSALAGMIDGFKERATGVAALLRDPATTFVLVSSPEREPVDEAIAFAAELRKAELPIGAVIVNRVHTASPTDPAAVAAALEGRLGARLAGAVAENLRGFQVLADRDRHSIALLQREAGDAEPILVPHLAGDVHDIDGLARVCGYLFS
jgi:anion-transporting  ArsA/GET3 family ATPase